MTSVIKVNNIDLIYRTTESLSIKKIVSMYFKKNESRVLNEYKALNNVSFELENGKVYGVIGNNGAGKSTLLRVLSGAMSPNSGEVIRNYSSINLLALGVGFSKELNGIDNIYLNGLLLGFSKNKIRSEIQNIIDYSEIGDFINKPMKTYSSGMISRLAFSVAINLQSEVLLIDEVLSVGDSRFREKSYKSISNIIKDKNTTVVLVSHSMGQVKTLCDYVIWLDKGKIISQGDTDYVLNLHNDYVIGTRTIDSISKSQKDSFTVTANGISIDCENYSINMPESNKIEFLRRVCDSQKTIEYKGSQVIITKRNLGSGDIFLYFEISKPNTYCIDIFLDEVATTWQFDHLYRRPIFDKRYGDNKISGFHSYIDLQTGSAVISKIIYYDQLEKVYTAEERSEVLEFKKESGDIKILTNGNISFSIENCGLFASCFILLSKEKIFQHEKHMNKYMEYYYDSLFNNNVWCSFFTRPSGTFTKLPYSIEPFTKDGYGFSLYHSSRKDMYEWLRETKERFFSDMMENAVLQAYIYQKNESGVFYTPYTSTWLFQDTKIRAPYIDTRLNESFLLMMEDYLPLSPFKNDLDPLRDYLKFLLNYRNNQKPIYQIGNGIFFPDYFSDKAINPSHSSLNHQLGIACLFFKAYVKYDNDIYLQFFNQILLFIENSYNDWVNPHSGDLYYGIKMDKNGSYIFFDTDYIYVTLIDLLISQKSFMEINNGIRNQALEYLTLRKIDYLKSTKYDLFNPNADPAPGEKLNSRNQALALYRGIYKDDN